jgi:hypothetical protein
MSGVDNTFLALSNNWGISISHCHHIFIHVVSVLIACMKQIVYFPSRQELKTLASNMDKLTPRQPITGAALLIDGTYIPYTPVYLNHKRRENDAQQQQQQNDDINHINNHQHKENNKVLYMNR